MYKVLIIDGNEQSRESLQVLLDYYDVFEAVGGCASGMDAIPIIEETQPHILFVDLDLADMTGLVLLELLPESCSAEIVFTTVDSRHSMHTLETFSLNYLVKPICESRFRETLVEISNRLAAVSSVAA